MLYNDKVYINMDKLKNELILEVMIISKIIYKSKADKSTADTFTMI